MKKKKKTKKLNRDDILEITCQEFLRLMHEMGLKSCAFQDDTGIMMYLSHAHKMCNHK